MNAQQRQSEIAAGLSSALFALVDTLDKRGVITFGDYRDSLRSLWDQMDEEDAQSGTAFLFERLIDLLNEADTLRNQ